MAHRWARGSRIISPAGPANTVWSCTRTRIIAALLYPPGRKPAYRVNNLQPFASQGPWWHLAPHLGFIFLHVSLPVLALLQGWGEPRLIFFNSIFSALIIWIMGDLVLAVMVGPRWRPAMDPRRVYA